MAKLHQGGQPVLNISPHGNILLAHLQTAAYARFQEGRGFFITFYGGFSDDGDPLPTNSLWCPPEVPLQFFYDEADEPIEIDADTIDALLKAMNDPLGVFIGPGGDWVWPFTLLTTDRPPPRSGD